MTDLTAVNLFAGIEGFGLAAHRADIRTVAAVEIDPAARGVIADQFPDTTLFTDVCEVTPDDLIAAGFVPGRGILTGGWPCQDLSVAGRRAGLGGARSGLFWQIVRLLAGLRPRWFVLENVPGLLSAVCPPDPDAARSGEGNDPDLFGFAGEDGLTNGRGACEGGCMAAHGGAMGLVLGALAGLGYGVAYRVLDAQNFGVPQQRRRVVFVGCAGDWAAPAEILFEPEGGGGHSTARRTPGQDVAVVTALRAGSGGGCGPDDNDAQGGRLVVGALQAQGTNGRRYRVDAEGAASGHLVIAGTLTAGMGSNAGHPGDAGKDELVLAVASALTAKSGYRLDDGQVDQLVPFSFDLAQITSATNRTNPGGIGQGHNATFIPVEPGGVAHALTSEGADASEDGTGRGTPLVPVALAFDWQTDGSERARPNVSIIKTSSLQAEKRDAVMAANAVRRLTPTECERLQGYPDGWTATSNGRPQADSPRYRQLGNTIAVPVFAWVLNRLAAVDANHKMKVAA